jgi:hypothetical protein
MGEVSERPAVLMPVDWLATLGQRERLDPVVRLLRLSAYYTGGRPGELHGLLVDDYREQDPSIRYFDITKQWTLPRKKFPSKYGPPKTRWSKRPIPVHPDLKRELDEWLENGWEAYVGRRPQPGDPLFPDRRGRPWREQRATAFEEELISAGLPTSIDGHDLTPYAIRHTFATMLKESGAPSDDRDRLLGHRPKDVKALNYEVVRLQHLYEEVCKLPSIVTRDRRDQGDNGGSTNCCLVPALVPEVGDQPAAISTSSMISAEERRFELLVPVKVRRFSKPLPSTTRPLLQVVPTNGTLADGRRRPRPI